jgi:uncharacterized membrane protein
MMEQTVELYNGLIPHPQHLERFESLLPGATGRFMALAERQSAHRQLMERKFLNFNGAASIIGAVSASLISLASVGGAIFLIYLGRSAQEVAACLVPLAPIVWAFRRARKSQTNEIRRKR